MFFCLWEYGLDKIQLADFLGLVNYVPVNKNKRSFSEARKFCRMLKLKSTKEWRAYVEGKIKGHDKIPSDLPSQPHTYYKNKGWVSYPDFLDYTPK